MNSKRFDARETLGRLNAILKRYDNESLELYHEETFIEDILYFIGKSLDEKQYGYDAKGYHRFLVERIYPIAQRVTKMKFTNALKRG